MNYVQIIEKNHIVELTFRFVPISRLMHSKKKKRKSCYRRIISITQSVIEIYTFEISIVIKIATKIKNMPVLLTYLFLEIVFVLCPSRNHV